MKNLKTLLIIILSVSVWSCQKDDIYELVDTAKIISQKDDIIDEVIEEVVDSTSTKETKPPLSGIVVSKNSNYIDYSFGARETYHYPNSRNYMNINGVEYFTIASNGWDSYLYKKIDTTWTLVHTATEYQIEGGNQLEMISENSFILAETGEQHFTTQSEWGGYMWIGTIENDRVSLNPITNVTSYYGHSSFGDLDGDGLGDINGGSWIFMQESNNSYKQISISNNSDTQFGTNPQDYVDPNFNLIDTTRFHELNSQSIVNETVDLFEGGRDELIYAFVDVSDRVSENEVVPRGDVLIYEFNENSHKYEVVFELPRRTVGEVESVSNIEVADVNNDGINDIILAITSGDSADNVNHTPPIEIWLGNTDKTFYKHMEFEKEVDITGFNLFDINHDGYLDIVLNPFGDSPDWIQNWCSSDCGDRQQNGEPTKDGLLLHKTIYLNDGYGGFNRIQKEIIIENTFVTSLFSFMRNDNLCFVGTVYKNLEDGSSAPMNIEFIDIEFNNYFNE